MSYFFRHYMEAKHLPCLGLIVLEGGWPILATTPILAATAVKAFGIAIAPALSKGREGPAMLTNSPGVIAKRN